MEDNKTGISHFLAFDLGATSGRGILGRLCDGILTVKELTRFPNGMMYLGRHMYWNIYSLYEKLCEGLTAAAAEKVGISAHALEFCPVFDGGRTFIQVVNLCAGQGKQKRGMGGNQNLSPPQRYVRICLQITLSSRGDFLTTHRIL